MSINYDQNITDYFDKLWPLVPIHLLSWPSLCFPLPVCPLGCSDNHIFSQSYQVSPIPVFFRTLVLRKYQKKIVTFAMWAEFFLTFSKICVLFKIFKTNFLSQYSTNLYKIFRESSLISI
jgi:hypothetical protein